MTYLDKILDHHRERTSNDSRNTDQLIEKIKTCAPSKDSLNAIADRPDGSLAIIAEIKKASPSKKTFKRHESLSDILNWAKSYEASGATCVSVLTDVEFFEGSQDDLTQVRKNIELPILRKDFTVSANDVVDARLIGADAVLLIAAALDDYEMLDFFTLATEIDLDVLFETHDEPEVERVTNIGAKMVGVNQRDLETFKVDTERAKRVGAAIPDGICKIAESGIDTADDAKGLKAAGYDAILVGEAIVTSTNPAEKVHSLKV